MATSLVDAQSVLAVDIGSINTRALLFDVVDGQYHFVASGVMASTVNAPYYDPMEGLHGALLKLQGIIGRALLDDTDSLIIPTNPAGAGVDRLVITLSAGPVLRVVTAGLLGDVSLESAQRLAATAGGQVVESTGLNDHRLAEVQLDAVLRAKPDLIILAGGTDNGATRSVLKMVDLTALICQLLPRDQRPEVLYAGNQALNDTVKARLEKLTRVQVAPNIRPAIDGEDLRPAQEALAHTVSEIRLRQLGGMESLTRLVSCSPLPTSQAFGRMIRFLSRFYTARPVLGIDLGANTTTVASAANGKLALTALSPFGTGAGAVAALQSGHLEDLNQWLPLHVPDEVVKEYLWQKSLFPASLPLTGETLAIEQAAVRQLLRLAMQQSAARWPGFPSAFEPIIAGGAALAQAASPGQVLLMLLDGLQPVGITTFFLDQYAITPALGAIAEVNSLLPAQVVETSAYLNLGTVICPVSSARYGTPVLKVLIDYGEGNVSRAEIKQGALTTLPVSPGQTVQVEFEPLHRIQIDPRRKESANRFKITGGVCGAVIDTRGRPLVLPADAPRRRELIKKWSLALT